MRLLALDTSTPATSVALCDLGSPGGSPLEARDDPPAGARPGHAARLLPLAAEVLQRGGCAWSELDRIVVGRGPGTFTGLRIGIATARGLASSLQVSLVGISTLESLALGGCAGEVPTTRPRPVLAVLDARRGEVFAAAWMSEGKPSPTGLGELVLAPSALSPERLAELVPGLADNPLAVGDGALAFRAILERAGAVIPPEASKLHRVTAINHCRLAHDARGVAPDQVHPEYLRLPDAELARRAAAQDGR